MNTDSNYLETFTTTSSESQTNECSYRLRSYDDGQVYPQIQLSVYLTGPDCDRHGFSSWLGRAGCTLADDPSKADFVVFTGGSDINPALYNQKKLDLTYCDNDRDQEDVDLYRRCRRERIPMLGICRGAQFLWAMLGGRLYQDIDGHNDGEHEIVYVPTQEIYTASSVHHQAVIPGSIPGLKLLAYARNVSTTRVTDTAINQNEGGTDFEIYAVERKGVIGIQGHPEYAGYPNYSRLCIEIIEQYFYDSQFTRFENGVIRLKSEVIA